MKGFQLAASAYTILYLTFLIIYFLFFGFNISTFLGFLLTLIVSFVIAIFLLIFMSPTFCEKDGSSNVPIYLETLFFGLLVYLIYLYLSSYVMPFYNNPEIPNQIKHDFIFGGVILSLFAVITFINSFVQSSAISNLNFYSFFIYLFILAMKIYIIWRQWSLNSLNGNNISSDYRYPRQEGGNWRNIWVREPDYLQPHRHGGYRSKRKVKSAFYEFS